ncbi:MAG: S8 family serine peptidase [Gemmatimonadaceae bacterium]
MTNRRPTTPTPRRTPFDSSAEPADRELIVIANPAAKVRAARGTVTTASPADTNKLTSYLASAGASMRPLFEVSVRREMRAVIDELTAGEDPTGTPDLSKYFKVEARDDELERVAANLRQLPSIQAAYVKPPTFPAVRVQTPHAGSPTIGTSPVLPERVPESINVMLPSPNEAPPATPDFSPRQGYLGVAPGGIDALFAATQPGGRGAGVRIIDIEGAWRFTHEDLTQNQGGVVAGTQSTDIAWRNHGTAVMGEFGGDVNGLGITGICPEANTRAMSIFGGMGSAAAIRRAADALSAGDIILIELHRPGPAATGVGQQGFIAIEWWPDDYDAIRYATSRGVIVVEAAGNGAVNLDDAIYDTPQVGFPASWANPFRRGASDSGAVLVGAGAPPPGTHGNDHGPDRSRLDFSNYGMALDAQGWGREVTTSGYGDLQGGSNEDFWYTDQFSGTSSASPIVVGALGCVQGNRRARAMTLLTPATARALLRSTGSPQQDAPGRPAMQRIGNRPNVRQMIGTTGGGAVALTVPLFRYWNPYNTDHFYTTNWAELGGGRYGWSFEGVQCYVASQQAPGMVPLYRYWNARIGDHFYTTSWSELGGGRYGWGFEGVQCFVYTSPAADRLPLYRYWNARIGDHFYTTNWSELAGGRYGWYFEGVQCFVATQVRPPDLGAPDARESGMGPRESQHSPAPESPIPGAGASGLQGVEGALMGDGSMGTAGGEGAELPPPTFVGIASGTAVPSTFSSGAPGESGVPATFSAMGPGHGESASEVSSASSFTVKRERGSGIRSITIQLGGDDG